MAPVYGPSPAEPDRFGHLLERLQPLLDKLLACPAHSRDRVPGVKHRAAPHAPGVYLFTEDGTHRYVGRTGNLNQRFGQHVAPKSRHNQAAFAFNIARRDAVGEAALVGLTREQLDIHPVFDQKYFAPAKERVRAMEFRFVVLDPNAPDAHALSTVFEVFAAMRLDTEGEFNLFATH